MGRTLVVKEKVESRVHLVAKEKQRKIKVSCTHSDQQGNNEM